MYYLVLLCLGRWSMIVSHLPKQITVKVKNLNTHLKKKLMKLGLDPSAHKPTMDTTLMNK